MNKLTDIVDGLTATFQQRLTCEIINDELTITLLPTELLEICNTLIAPPYDFELLIDLCGVDYLHYGIDEWQTTNATGQGFSRGKEIKATNVAIKNMSAEDDKDAAAVRFTVVYHLLSIKHNQRLRIQCQLVNVPTESLIVPSVVDIWQSANWYEREAFDLFGIVFAEHPDLRRILTDYNFVGHPFRKDFPLIGEVEVRYDATEQRVVYEPVSIEPRTLVPKVIR